jgi:hypothetical protein
MCVCVCVCVCVCKGTVKIHKLRVCIREVPGLNLGPQTGYPDWGFSWFSSLPPNKCWDSTLKLGHHCFLWIIFQFIIHSSRLIRRYIVGVTAKASLNGLQKRHTNYMYVSEQLKDVVPYCSLAIEVCGGGVPIMIHQKRQFIADKPREREGWERFKTWTNAGSFI